MVRAGNLEGLEMVSYGSIRGINFPMVAMVSLAAALFISLVVLGGDFRTCKREYTEISPKYQIEILSHDITRNLPEEAASSSSSGEILYYEIQTCPGLRLAYHHIYKNAGTSMMNELGNFCQKVTGNSGKTLKSWILTEQSPPFQELCKDNFCYTFWREPVDRFLSAYHELMKRTDNGTNPWPAGWEVATTHRGLFPLINARLGLQRNATDDDKLDSFLKFWDLVHSGVLKDAHVQPQVDFLSLPGSSSLNMSDIAYFEMSRGQEILPLIFCGSYARSGMDGACPYHPDKMKHERNRFSEWYGEPQYMIKESQLDDDVISSIVQFYCRDYCIFGIPVHSRVSSMNIKSCCQNGE